MVVMEDGLPKRSDYRRFKVSAVQGNDDYGAMYEVLTRRLRRLAPAPAAGAASPAGGRQLPDGEEPDAELRDGEEREGELREGELPEGELRDGEEPEDEVLDDDPGDAAGDEPMGRRRSVSRFAYPPQLLLLDGGRGQLNVGVRVLEELGLTGSIELAALAKQFEEVYVPGRDEPVRLPRDSQAIYLLQQIRDEAHRFAITYHRELRGKRMTKGALDGIPGLGPTRRRRLAAELGGVRAVRAASLEELRQLRWLPDTVAVAVYERLHPEAPAARPDRAAG
jgi:excinuclease ABC subunit C